MDHGELVNRAMEELEAVHRLASHLTADGDVVDDLVHATFELAWRGAARPADLGPGDVRPWLFKLLVDALKTRLGDPLTPPTPLERAMAEAGLGIAGQTPCCYDLSTLDWDGAGGRLARVVRELPLAYRAVFLLWSVERLGYGQIAAILGLSEAVVRGRLYRARMIVSTQLGQFASEWGLGVGEMSGA